MVGCGGRTQTSSNQSNSNNASQEQKTANRNSGTQSQPLSGGSIEVTSSPAGARVLLVDSDEGGAGEPQARGVTPLTITGLKPGKYTVDLERQGYKFFQKEVTVKTGATVKVNAALKKH